MQRVKIERLSETTNGLQELEGQELHDIKGGDGDYGYDPFFPVFPIFPVFPGKVKFKFEFKSK